MSYEYISYVPVPGARRFTACVLPMYVPPTSNMIPVGTAAVRLVLLFCPQREIGVWYVEIGLEKHEKTYTPHFLQLSYS